MSSRSLVFALLAALVAVHGRLEAQALKVGVFDPQRVSETTALGKEMQGTLEKLQDEKLAVIEDLRKEISSLQKQLAEQRLSLSSDSRTRLEMNIQRRLLALEAAQESSQREMQLELAAAKSQFEDRLLEAVAAFGRDEGFQLILDRSLVAFADQSVDVTSALIDRFDRMFPVAPAER
jgi:Skp family chaperone for outer membrane proteins